MQTKLHRWAAADHGRRFDDLFNLVCDPATLLVAFERVAGNKGARTPGVDGLTVVNVERELGLPGYLEDLQRVLKTGEFRPLPVRERKIPKPGGSGKVRKLGIPTVSDRVVQAALKLVLEPIFEADFLPVSYGFRPMRRAHDAIAEIHRYGTSGYRWVLDADIEACFDSIDHTAQWTGCARESRTSACCGWSRRSSRPASSLRAAAARRPSPALRRAASFPRCWRTSPCPRSMRGPEVPGQAPNRVVLNEETRKKWRHPVSTRR
ncbi:reverse transcriptase domain-containing protein, partial [Streptomyces sp. NPDC005122]